MKGYIEIVDQKIERIYIYIWTSLNKRKKTMELGNRRCIKGKIIEYSLDMMRSKKNWTTYFLKIYNKNPVKGVGLDNTSLPR